MKHDILFISVQSQIVAFFFHWLHLLAFLTFGFGRFIFSKAFVHIILDFSQYVPHFSKLSLECLHIHVSIFFRELTEVKGFCIYAITGADHIGDAV